MRTLVIDPDPVYAATLGQVLKGLECQVDVASTTSEAVAFLKEKRFDVILMDVRWLSSTALVILQELYSDVFRHLDSPRIRLMSTSTASSLLAQAQSNGALKSIPATAESILSIVRSTDDSNGVLVAGAAASAELIHTLLQEDYPAVVVHNLDDAIRHLLHGTYPVVFLETALAGSDSFMVLQGLIAEPLACLASTQNDSYLWYVLKPQTTVEIRELLTDLQRELSDAEIRMSAGRA